MKSVIFGVCLVTLVQRGDATTYSCEVYRQNFDTAEYGDMCYGFRKERMSWYGAKESCEVSGGRLVRLENSDQYDYLMNGENYYDKDGKVSEGAIVIAWIDGQKQNGRMYWSDGQLMTFTMSTIFETLFESTELGCIHATRSIFAVQKCSDVRRYICEYAKQPTPLKTNPPPTTALLTSAITSTEGTTTVHTNSRDQPNADRACKRKRQTVSKIRSYGVFIKGTPLFEQMTHGATMCSRACTSFHDCILFNFNPESGECKGYTDKDETYMEEKEIWQLWAVV